MKRIVSIIIVAISLVGCTTTKSSVDKALELDAKRRALIQEGDTLRAKKRKPIADLVKRIDD